jgi:hypothetical protein
MHKCLQRQNADHLQVWEHRNCVSSFWNLPSWTSEKASRNMQYSIKGVEPRLRRNGIRWAVSVAFSCFQLYTIVRCRRMHGGFLIECLQLEGLGAGELLFWSLCTHNCKVGVDAFPDEWTTWFCIGMTYYDMYLSFFVCPCEEMDVTVCN